MTDTEFLRKIAFHSSHSTFDAKARNAVDVLLSHFSKRIESGWPTLPSVLTDLRLDMGSMTDAEIIHRANAALSNNLHPSGIQPSVATDGQIDWGMNPSESREWLLMIHRHAWWVLWATAYKISGDVRYVDAFISQLNHWIDSNPMPARKSENIESWRLMEVGLRMRVTWIPVFGAFYEAAAFDNQSKMKMLRAIYDHGQFLYCFHTNRNHLVRESNGLVATGLCFPEFMESEQWASEGLRRLDAELCAQLNPDGSHIEMSVGYQWLTIDEFEVTRSLLNKYGRKLPQSNLDEALIRMYEFLASVIRPDRTFPQINDGFILWDAERLAAAAREFERDDLEYIGSGGKSGMAPEFCSRSFPNAGFHIMRSDWSAESPYLLFDAGPYGGPHGHEDKLSIEVSANGVPFIVDPGSYTYEATDPFRNYFVGSQGHNAVLVDNGSQIRRWDQQHMTPKVDETIHGEWKSSDDFDYASGVYNEGYADFALKQDVSQVIDTDVTHQREIVFLKPDYWIVVDRLVAEKRHQYSFLFHLAPDVSVLSSNSVSALVRSDRNGSSLLIRALGVEFEQSRVLSGCVNPIQGWFSHDHHRKIAAPTLSFEIDSVSMLTVAWVIMPLPAAADARDIRVDGLSVTGSGGFAYGVRSERFDDRMLVADSPRTRSFGHFKSTSTLTVIRQPYGNKEDVRPRFDR